MSEIGHNSMHSDAGERLKGLIERIERLEEEKQSLSADQREVFAEAKSAGFDTKIMRQIIRLRKFDEADRLEQDSLLATYMHACGMVRQIDMFESGELPPAKAGGF